MSATQSGEVTSTHISFSSTGHTRIHNWLTSTNDEIPSSDAGELTRDEPPMKASYNVQRRADGKAAIPFGNMRPFAMNDDANDIVVPSMPVGGTVNIPLKFHIPDTGSAKPDAKGCTESDSGHSAGTLTINRTR